MAHDHAHTHEVTHIGKAFIAGIVLNAVYVIVELTVGIMRSSLSLITDAGHNATDVFSLLLSLLAFRLLRVKATENYSYGFKKVSILVSLLNAVLLVFAVGVVFYEGIWRISHPVAVPGFTISVVALAGVAVNAASAFLFFREKDKDINIKGAYLHLLADALISLAVVAGGVLIYFTHFEWIDPALSFLVGLIILKSTWTLLNDSIRMALDGTPKDVDLQKIRETVLKHPEISDIHHVHVWAISSRQNAMTAHLVLTDGDLGRFAQLKYTLRHELAHLNIHHVTLEVENEQCGEQC